MQAIVVVLLVLAAVTESVVAIAVLVGGCLVLAIFQGFGTRLGEHAADAVVDWLTIRVPRDRARRRRRRGRGGD